LERGKNYFPLPLTLSPRRGERVRGGGREGYHIMKLWTEE
jgi:hypothetical protein